MATFPQMKTRPTLTAYRRAVATAREFRECAADAFYDNTRAKYRAAMREQGKLAIHIKRAILGD